MDLISRIILLLPRLGLGAMMASAALAQQGPELPCLGCPEPSERRALDPVPETGIWRNPEQSGTGFMLEVQGSLIHAPGETFHHHPRLAGYYYLYNESGAPLWYAFNGPLEPVGDGGIMWTLDTDLERFEGGACLKCPYQPAQLGESPGTIRFEFLHRGYARFSVNGAPFQYILPLTYGVSGSRIFQPHSDYLMPDLSGFWALRFLMPWTGGTASDVLGFTRISGTPGVTRYRLWIYDTVHDASQVSDYGQLECRASEIEGPICELRFVEDGSPVYLEHQVFVLRPGDVTDSRFFAEAESGWSIEAFRVRHD